MELPERIRKICVNKLSNGTSFNMAHTDHGLYSVREDTPSPSNLIPNSYDEQTHEWDYEIPEFGHV